MRKNPALLLIISFCINGQWRLKSDSVDPHLETTFILSPPHYNDLWSQTVFCLSSVVLLDKKHKSILRTFVFFVANAVNILRIYCIDKRRHKLTGQIIF